MSNETAIYQLCRSYRLYPRPGQKITNDNDEDFDRSAFYHCERVPCREKLHSATSMRRMKAIVVSSRNFQFYSESLVAGVK